MQSLLKTKLYTILLWYKSNTYIYQVFGKDHIEAQLKWLEKIDLDEVGAINTDGIKQELISDAKVEIFFPILVKKFQNIWNTSVTSLSHNDSINKDYPISYIIKTLNSVNSKALSIFLQKQTLYTMQLDYKNNIYVEQVLLAGNPMDAKMKWLKEFDFNVVYGIPKNILEIKNNLLSQQNDPEFIPQELPEFQSVWITKLELGDDIGRVTIVATQTNIISN